MTMKYIILTLVCVLLYSIVVESVPLKRESSLIRGLRHRNVMLSKEQDTYYSPQWFQQKVDHFNPLNQDTFRQQFFVNDTYWKPGGPVFLVLGGEGPISPAYVNGHFIVNTYAQMFDALIVAVEHRFYGQSSPSKDLSTKYLYLLTAEQALADYAYFQQFFTNAYRTGSSKWISFGGSYSGALSAWMRLKYPQLIDAAIATSAPVQAQLDFPEYFEVVSRSIGDACSAVVRNVTNVVTQMLQTDRVKVQKLFNACDPIVTDLDVATFMESLSGAISEIVQYNNDNNKYTMANISTMCNYLMQGDPLTSFVSFNNKYNIFSASNCTTSSYNSMINQLKDVTVNGNNAASRLWTYQTCIEFGFFQTGESQDQPFSDLITLDYFVQQCTDIFGPPGASYNPNTQWILTDYGGKDLQSSQIVMPNGLVDPWHILGVTNSTTSSIYTIVIPDTAHCADLYPPLATDPPGLVLARKMQVDLISSIVYGN